MVYSKGINPLPIPSHPIPPSQACNPTPTPRTNEAKNAMQRPFLPRRGKKESKKERKKTILPTHAKIL